jgi:hypothetical protein
MANPIATLRIKQIPSSPPLQVVTPTPRPLVSPSTWRPVRGA